MNKTHNTIFAIDIGNTNIHCSYVNNGNIQDDYKRYRHTDISILPWDNIKKNNISVVISSQLLHMTDLILDKANEYEVNVTEITVEKQTAIKKTYPTLGMDRICNLAAALKLFPESQSPIVVFDFGTATTISSCDSQGNFLGGIITTGCEIELNALSGKTFSLPHVELAKEQKINKLNVLAKTTEDALLNGVITGQIGLIEYFLSNFEKEIKQKPKIVFTGGNAKTIHRFVETKCDLYDPHLTIKGIYHCFQSSLVHK